ncbi:hypothetical protein DL766_002145 [Monosporascus sp. MC13-8B]|uniref:Magnesium transporter n=1 Tax=Monosporascus cannonballus TaxID=155416 RepID=A0ABY0HGX0_9PEZI|nr:hypothetical protein DL763_007945 [Monosporascus cannonballus]RYO93206.1 hypothetical protein DL762_001155 [Monosporascus cannonballus]RYP36096.1 hypothetical protein DL766_002145 [Monosporascus sp. MC13-8B]
MKPVVWEPQSPSIVYNCKSDTESPAGENDIAMSTTCFTGKHITFAVMYGCTESVMQDTMMWLKRLKGSGKISAFHPLILPMVFAEFERKRLLNMLDRQGSHLNQRIIDMENKLTGRLYGDDRNITERDCETTKLWVDVSRLQNGLQSLKAELMSMIDHLDTLSKNELGPGENGSDNHSREREAGSAIRSRLLEMVTEFDSKIRHCEGLLGGIALATQMEWNYYSRRDAGATIEIAVASKRDSSQMRYISYLGMMFLPGTFLATMFSMTFFNWIPPDSNETISPWVSIYLGMTVVSTGCIIWYYRKQMRRKVDSGVEWEEKV